MKLQYVIYFNLIGTRSDNFGNNFFDGLRDCNCNVTVKQWVTVETAHYETQDCIRCYSHKSNQYTVLEFHFRSVKCTVVTRLRKNSSNFSFLFKRYKPITVCVDVNNPLQKVFKRVYTVYTYWNPTINKLLYCWEIV